MKRAIGKMQNLPERQKGQKMHEQGCDKMTIFGNSNVVSRSFLICIFFDKKKKNEIAGQSILKTNLSAPWRHFRLTWVGYLV